MKMLFVIVIIVLNAVQVCSSQPNVKQYYSKSTPFLGHVMFSADASLMFTWNEYGGSLWDTKNGAKIGRIENEYRERNGLSSEFEGNYSTFEQPVLSNDGKYVGHHDRFNGVSVWNTKRQIVIKSIKPYANGSVDIDDNVQFYAYDNDPEFGSDGIRKIKLVEIDGGSKEMTGIFQHKNRVTSIRIHSQQKQIVSGGEFGAVYVWNYDTDKVISLINSEASMTEPHCLFNNRGDKVVVFSKVGVTVFDANTGERIFHGYGWGSVTKECNSFITRLDSIINIYDVDSGEIVSFPVTDDSSINKYEKSVISSNKKFVATIDIKGIIRIYDVEAKRRMQTIQLNSKIVAEGFHDFDMLFNPIGDQLVFSTKRFCYRFDVKNGTLLQGITALHKEEIKAQFTKREGYLYVENERGNGYVYDFNNSQYILKDVLNDYTLCAYNESSDMLAVYNHTDSITFYNVSSGQLIKKMSGRNGVNYSVKAVRFNEKGNHTMVFFNDGSVQVFDTEKSTYLYTLKLTNGSIDKIVYTENNNRCLAMSTTEAVMYNANTGSKVAAFPNINSYSNFSMNEVGDKVMTTNKIYNGNTGALLKEMKKPGDFDAESYMRYGLLLRDGNTAVTVSEYKLFFWDIATSNLLKKMSFYEKSTSVADISFTKDDKNYFINFGEEYGGEIIMYSSDDASKVIYGLYALRPFTSYQTDLLNERILTISRDNICRIWTPGQSTSAVENETALYNVESDNLTVLHTTPASKLHISLHVPIETDTPFSVYNIVGQKIYNGIIPAHTNYLDVDVESWQQGAYFVELVIKEKRNIQEFYIIR